MKNNILSLLIIDDTHIHILNKKGLDIHRKCNEIDSSCLTVTKS